MPKDYVLHNARLVLPREVRRGSLVIRGGRIAAILAEGEALPQDLASRDAEGRLVTPGLIELHIHGAGGVGFDALGSTPEEGAASLAAARDFLRGRGVTTFLPTLVCREGPIAALAAAIESGGFAEEELPGIYVEGPFIAASRKGGIPLDTIRGPNPALLARLLGLARGRLRLMTLAPELEGASGLYGAMKAAAVLPCLGHSDASIDAIELPEGPFAITHLFNAMSPFSHKAGEAGLAMLPFARGGFFVELNADGVHVNESALRASARAIGRDDLILISDATVAAGMAWGDYEYYGARIRSGADGVRYADSNLLMGSNRLGPDLVRNWMRVTGASLSDAVAAMSLNPARLLGLEGSRGSIAPGREAVLALWNGELESLRELL